MSSNPMDWDWTLPVKHSNFSSILDLKLGVFLGKHPNERHALDNKKSLLT